MPIFEKVKRFEDAELTMPVRATKESAGYDFCVAEETIIPPWSYCVDKLQDEIFSKDSKLDYYGFTNPRVLDTHADVTKAAKARSTLVPTGIKCKLDPGTYLEISLRSSIPLKYGLILANGIGIIDGDYYGNSSNDGEIFFQVINLSPFAIKLQKGDRIGQGIIKRYYITDDDSVTAERDGGLGSTDESSVS